MCGISGVLSNNPQDISREIIKDMNGTLLHRGPDDTGCFIDKKIAIGHKRLSIIDLSEAAKQPMISENSRYVITYNGEIYNYKELKELLLMKGHKFRTQSDTEVVLNSFLEWGLDSFNLFNGMFALAVWDKEEEILYIARDRYGIKPLYFSFEDSRFIFASEIKSIAAHPKFIKKINNNGLAEYFTFQNFISSNTLYQNVQILEPGTYKIININQKNLKTHTYWNYNFHEDKSLTKEECVEELEFQFKRAIKRNLVADVELGTYLSGGIDSGSITSLVSRNSNYLKTFTCGFDLNSATGIELGFDERNIAELMSYSFKTEHYEIVLKSGDMERIMKDLVNHIEEPRVGQSYPNYFVSKLASKFVKVVLSGTGGDEIFGGYPWRYMHGISSKSENDFIEKYFNSWRRLLSKDEFDNLFKPLRKELNYFDPRLLFKEIFEDFKSEKNSMENYINMALHFEAKTFLHGLLVIEDKISMANSLETRVPFLDNDLVDFAMKIPIKYKIKNIFNNKEWNENDFSQKNYFKKTNDGKNILREAMKKYLPREVYLNQKKGFSAPDASWFKGESLEYVKAKILKTNSRINDFFDPNVVKSLVNEHLIGNKNRRLLIWSLLYFEEWLDLNF